MKLMYTLALRHMTQNRKRSIFTIIGIVLSVAMITAVSGFVFSAQVAYQDLIKDARGDWHVTIADVTAKQAESIMSDAMVKSGYTKETEGVMNVYFRLTDPGKGVKQGQEIADRHGVKDKKIEYNMELLAAEGYMVAAAVLVLYTLGAILGLIIMVGSVIVIANAFNISTGERVRQFGILKSTGATSEQIRMSVLIEGAILSSIGIPLGILIGFGVQFVGITIANTLTLGLKSANGIAIQFKMIISLAIILISVVTSFITVLLSAWYPARKVSRISAIDAIRQSDEVKIKPGSVKTSWLTQKVFGFEGTLAAKSLKRSRRKYRATVISLVVSIVFAIISASFGSMLFSSLSVIYPDIDATVIVTPKSGVTVDEAARYTEKLSGFPDADIHMAGITYIDIEADANIYSADAKKHWNTEIPEQANLICLDETTYADLCKQAGVNFGDAVLLNYALFRTNDSRIEFEPVQFTPYTHKLHAKDGNALMLEVAGQITAPSAVLKVISEPKKVNFIVPTAFLRDAGLKTEAAWLVDVPDAAGFLLYADEQLKGFAGQYQTSNIDAETAMIKNIYLLVMIFVYGFIGMLSLIGITSVISTISTIIRLRTQEFAVLKSVGMTQEGLRKMLNLESFLYGLKSLFIGLPLGMLMSYGLNYLLGMAVSFNLIVPWPALGACVFAVMAITFMTMHYAARQLKRDSIVDAMKMVNV